jgi:hypothetical protein
LKANDDVETLVNACLDTSGIDRRYSAIILEELRDCTNLTHDQLREAAHELTAALGANTSPYPSLRSSTHVSPSTINRPSSSNNYPHDSANQHVHV